MGRRDKRSQGELPGVDTRPRPPVTIEHRSNFAAMELGRGVGTGYRIVPCPVCLAHCIAMVSPTGLSWTFVHRGRFVAGPRHTRLEPERACRMVVETMTALANEGTVKLSASGGLIAVTAAAPSRVVEIEQEREKRRKLTEGGRQ